MRRIPAAAWIVLGFALAVPLGTWAGDPGGSGLGDTTETGLPLSGGTMSGDIELNQNNVYMLTSATGNVYIDDDASGNFVLRRRSNDQLIFEATATTMDINKPLTIRDNINSCWGTDDDYCTTYSTVDTDLCFTHTSNGELFCMNDAGTSSFASSVTFNGGLTTGAADDVTIGNNGDIVFLNQTNGASFIQSGTQAQLTLLMGTSLGRQLTIGDLGSNGSDFDHAAPTNPTVYIHSATNPDTDNTQWGSLAHDQTDFVVSTGSGAVKLSAEVEATGISGDGAGSVVCVKSDGDLGTCSDAPDVSGNCTCG